MTTATTTLDLTDAPTLSFAEAVNDALAIAMELDDSVFVLGEDVSDPTGGGVAKCTKGLSTRFGIERVRHTPISEQAIMGAAVGAAVCGMRPVAEIMLMNFIPIALDQLANHAAKLRYMSGGQTNVPLTVRTVTGGGAGFGAQHSEMLEAWLAHEPGLRVVMPSSPAEAKGLLLSCIFDDDPCVVIEHMMLTQAGRGPVPAGDYRIPLGVANIVHPGRDITLITYGLQVGYCETVAEQLGREGISVEVIDLRTVAPFDTATIFESVQRTHRAVVVHEAVKPFGVGAEIACRLTEELWGTLEAPVARVGSSFNPVPFGFNLEQAHLPSVDDITAAVRTVLG